MESTNDIIESTVLNPIAYHRVNKSDIGIESFDSHKTFICVSGSSTASCLPLNAVFSSRTFLPALGSELTFNDSKNIDDSLQTVIYYSLDHLFYRRRYQPSKTTGFADISRTTKNFFQSASVFSIPSDKVGDRIRSESIRIFVSGSSSSLYGSGKFGSSLYDSFFTPDIVIRDDRFGNLYDESIDTARHVADTIWYEGFNEYFDTTRIPYQSKDIKYVPGVTTISGLQTNIGYAATFSSASDSYISIENLPGQYDRDSNYSISFFISASNGAIMNDLILGKVLDNQTTQYPFKIELSGSNELIFSVQSNSDLKAQLVSSQITGSWTHVTCQRSGSDLQIYIDGIIDASGSYQLLSSGSCNNDGPQNFFSNNLPLQIGGYITPGSSLNGSLDEIRIYNKALSSVQIGYLADRDEAGSLLQTNCVGHAYRDHGIIVITSADYRYEDFINKDYSLSYQSSVTIHELQAMVRIGADKLNVSQNVSLQTDIPGDTCEITRTEEFNPYITTVALYNDQNEMVAVAKLAQPIQKRRDVDMNIIVRIDLDQYVAL